MSMKLQPIPEIPPEMVRVVSAFFPSVANPPRIRDHEHATERASARSGKRRHPRAGRAGCHSVWTGCLRTIGRAAHAQFLFFLVFAT
jgi:hypothetical protein